MLQVVEWIVGLVSGLLASQMGMNTTWFWAFSALSLSALLGASSALFYNVGAPGYWGPPTPSVGSTKVTRGFPSLPAMIGIGRQLLTSIGFALMAIGTFETLGIYLPPFVHGIIALIGGIVLFDAIANRGTSSFPMIGIRAPALAAMSAACLYTIFFAYASHSTITAAKIILFGTLFLSANDVIPHVWGPDAFDGYGAATGKLMLIPGLYAVSHGVHMAQPYLSKWIPGM